MAASRALILQAFINFCLVPAAWAVPAGEGAVNDGPPAQVAPVRMASKPATYSLKERVRRANRGKSCELIVRYPEFRGSGRPPIDALVRQQITRIANGVRKEYETEVTNAGENACRDGSAPVSYSLDYSVPYQGPRYLAVEFKESTFTGGAHPNHLVFGLNLDLKAGRAVSLEDIVTSGGLAEINKVVKKGLTDQLGETESFFEGYESLAQPQFTISAEGLRFVFSPYEVASYAHTPESVTVPWENVRRYLKHSFSTQEF